MLPRRHLREDAAILSMQVHLRSNDIAEQVTAIGHHSRSRFVTRGFDAEDQGHEKYQRLMIKD